MHRPLRIFLAAVAVLLLFTLPAAAQGISPADKIRSLIHPAEEGIEAAEQNKPEIMRSEYDEIHTLWESFEDQVREADPQAYVELETALDQLKDAVNAQPLDAARVKSAYAHLKDETTEIAGRLGTAPASAGPAEVTLPEAIRLLDAAASAVNQGDASTAGAQFGAFVRAWPAIEGPIATKSRDAYEAIEGQLGSTRAALTAQPADLAAAKIGIERIQAELAPFGAEQTYTWFDAAAIILREGLEALLVIVALLAFLRKSGNADKRGWIWAGGALGVLASIVTAFALQAIFSRVSAGANRELIEGMTGLVAAILLFYVSYWLHSKASLGAWKQYIDQRTTQALARGSMAGLALLAFLAVFREGAETAVFYLGMAPAIALRELLIGMGLGVVVLVVAAVLMLVVGVKLPLRPFFRVAGLLVYYLGFKFVGTGLHALQIAGAIPATPIPGLESNPVFEFFGIFPTWQTLLPQVALLLGALVAWLYLRAQDQKVRAREAVAAV